MLILGISGIVVGVFALGIIAGRMLESKGFPMGFNDYVIKCRQCGCLSADNDSECNNCDIIKERD